MCKDKRHKSEKHSSVFQNGSLNQSADEKADTSLFGLVQNGSYLAVDSSDFGLIHHALFCCKTVAKRDTQLSSHSEQCVPFLRALMSGSVYGRLYVIWVYVTKRFIDSK